MPPSPPPARREVRFVQRLGTSGSHFAHALAIVVPSYRAALAALVELETLRVKLRLVTPPDQVPLAFAETERRRQDRRMTEGAALLSVYEDVAAGRWP